MSYGYAKDKMHLAMLSLVGPGSIKYRVHTAVAHQLIHISPKADLPEVLHSEFNELMQNCRHSLRLSEAEAQCQAQLIVCLHAKMNGDLH